MAIDQVTNTVNLLNINFQANDSVWCYLLSAAIASLLLRLALCSLRALEQPNGKFASKFWVAFRGFGEGGQNAANDYWQTFILGFLEACAFPIFIAINKPEYLAGWLILKTLPQWKRWSDTRNIYNRFLIGNAGIMLFSWFMARHFFA